MNRRWVLLGALALAGVLAAVLLWPQSDPAQHPAQSAGPSEPSEPQPNTPQQVTPDSAAMPPSAAVPLAPEGELDGGAATLAQRLESNRLLKEAQAAGGFRQLGLYEDALKANPDNVDALMELGELRLENEDYDDAERLAKRCLKLAKQNPRCRQTLVWRYTRTGDFASAAKLHEGCLEEPVVDASCLSFSIGAALRAGDVPRAKELHVRLAALAPDSISTILLEAAIARADGDDASARAAYEKSCDRGNEFACTWLAKNPEE